MTYYDLLDIISTGKRGGKNDSTGIFAELWWNEVKDREIKEWNIIGGGMYKVELWIDLEE